MFKTRVCSSIARMFRFHQSATVSVGRVEEEARKAGQNMEGCMSVQQCVSAAVQKCNRVQGLARLAAARAAAGSAARPAGDTPAGASGASRPRKRTAANTHVVAAKACQRMLSALARARALALFCIACQWFDRGCHLFNCHPSVASVDCFCMFGWTVLLADSLTLMLVHARAL